jgi:N-acetylneuraminate synthase
METTSNSIRWKNELRLANHCIDSNHPTCFIADIGSNHDGDLRRAQDLIFLAKEAGANVAKFQHFHAESIASDFGFRHLPPVRLLEGLTRPIYEIYQEAAMKRDWTPVLAETCRKAGITFLTTPTSPELVAEVDRYVPAFKVASGDLTWTQLIERMAARHKPVLLSTGMATLDEVQLAVEAVLRHHDEIVLLQCNVDYTVSADKFPFVHLNVLKMFQELYPGMPLGLSDHTPGHAAVLGAIALGGRVIEKHFTDDNARPGADHAISMNPGAWKEMVQRARELESALGSGKKALMENEREWVILQRRALRAKRSLAQGTVLQEEMFDALRPCPRDAIPPYELPNLTGRTIKRSLQAGEHITWRDLGEPRV